MKVHELLKLLESSSDENVVVFQEEDGDSSFTIDSVLDKDGFCILVSEES